MFFLIARLCSLILYIRLFLLANLMCHLLYFNTALQGSLEYVLIILDIFEIACINETIAHVAS